MDSDHRAEQPANSALQMLAEELKQLRLPHKLKQYRQYCKRIEQLRTKIISDEQQEIDQLYTILDKSVICGVDQCFLCNCNSDSCGGKSSSLDSTIKPMKQEQSQVPTLEEQNQFDGSVVNKIGINVEVHDETNCKNNGNLAINSNNNLKSSLESNSDSSSIPAETGIEENVNNTINCDDQPDGSCKTNGHSFDDGDSSESTTNDQESEQGSDHQDNSPCEHKENSNELVNGNSSIQAPKAFIEPLMIDKDSNRNNNNYYNNGDNKTSLCSPTIMSPRPYQKANVGRSNPFIINNNSNNSYKAYKNFIKNYSQAQTIAQTNKD